MGDEGALTILSDFSVEEREQLLLFGSGDCLMVDGWLDCLVHCGVIVSIALPNTGLVTSTEERGSRT